MSRKKSARELWQIAEAANKERKRAFRAWQRAVDKAESATRAEDAIARNGDWTTPFLTDAERNERYKLRAAADHEMAQALRPPAAWIVP